MSDRYFVGYECDHLRPVIRHMCELDVDYVWYHIDENDGTLINECESGVYKVKAVYSGDHYLKDLVTEYD